jgi:hypothetical protein
VSPLSVVLFGGAGVLAYLTFGSEIQTVVLVNLNLESKMVQAVSSSHPFSGHRSLSAHASRFNFFTLSLSSSPSLSSSSLLSELWRMVSSHEVASPIQESSGRRISLGLRLLWGVRRSHGLVQPTWINLWRSLGVSLGT